MSTLRDARDELAAGITAGSAVHGYPRPPGQVAVLPAAVVMDPRRIQYHTTAGKKTVVELVVRVIVGSQAAQDSVARLDELVSRSGIPAVLEAITGGSWHDLAVVELEGPYADFRQGDQRVGVAADLVCRLTFNNTTT